MHTKGDRAENPSSTPEKLRYSIGSRRWGTPKAYTPPYITGHAKDTRKRCGALRRLAWPPLYLLPSSIVSLALSLAVCHGARLPSTPSLATCCVPIIGLALLSNSYSLAGKNCARPVSNRFNLHFYQVYLRFLLCSTLRIAATPRIAYLSTNHEHHGGGITNSTPRLRRDSEWSPSLIRIILVSRSVCMCMDTYPPSPPARHLKRVTAGYVVVGTVLDAGFCRREYNNSSTTLRCPEALGSCKAVFVWALAFRCPSPSPN